MQTKKLALFLLPESFGICRLDEKSPIPDWVFKGNFFSVTLTQSELSIVFAQKDIPGGVLYEKNWRGFKLESVGDIHSVGIIASLANPLAEAGISLFNISTYETNYLLLEEKNLAMAKKILGKFCVIKE